LTSPKTKRRRIGSGHPYSKTVLRRWSDGKSKPHQGYLVSTLYALEAAQIAKLYDGKEAMDVDTRADKRELGIEKRRKESFHAQEALMLLAQLAHNMVIFFKRWFLGGTKAEKLGMERSVRKLMRMPAEVRVGRRGRKSG